MKEFTKLDSSWDEISEIIPFGYGRIARRVIGKLKEDFNLPFIIDNNLAWQTKRTEIEIKTFDQARENIGNRKIVVLTTEMPYISIKKELEKEGYIENKDFCILSRFVGEWYMKNRNQLCISKIDTIITSRCTLPCPHCAMNIHHCTQRIDYPVDEVCKNFDTVFSAIDYVVEYCLFGGEPLIYNHIIKLINYLMGTYGDRIGRLVLITNGNVRPSDEVLDILKKYNVLLSVSDYTHYYDYKKTQEDFLARLEKREIEYSINTELVWKDHGYPTTPANYSGEGARQHFKTCGHSAFSINNGILYYCDGMFGAEVNTNYKTRPDDVINIREYAEKYGMDRTKNRILQYITGDINEEGTPSFCKLCKGIGDDNQDIIIAGS